MYVSCITVWNGHPQMRNASTASLHALFTKADMLRTQAPQMRRGINVRPANSNPKTNTSAMPGSPPLGKLPQGSDLDKVSDNFNLEICQAQP